MDVSLFVRLWVEIMNLAVFRRLRECQPLREAVSWNIQRTNYRNNCLCQPLREAVSWNTGETETLKDLGVSASSWGCELKSFYKEVSLIWPMSASSWGCELKFQKVRRQAWTQCQPLREAVSWNANWDCNALVFCMSASSWGCELKCNISTKGVTKHSSASSWGCELKYCVHLWSSNWFKVGLFVRL